MGMKKVWDFGGRGDRISNENGRGRGLAKTMGMGVERREGIKWRGGGEGEEDVIGKEWQNFK